MNVKAGLTLCALLAAGCGGVDLNRSSLELRPQSGLAADGEQAADLTLKLVDTSGLPVAGVPVELQVTGGGAWIEPARVATGADGVATARLRSREPGAKRVSALVDPEGQRDRLAQAPQATFQGTAPVAPGPNRVALAMSYRGAGHTILTRALEAELLSAGFAIAADAAVQIEVTVEDPQLSSIGGFYKASGRLTGRATRDGAPVVVETVTAESPRSSTSDGATRELWDAAAKALVSQLSGALRRATSKEG